jgi:hypothetical protein
MLLFLAFDLSGAMDATHHWWTTLAALSAVAVLLPRRERWRLLLCGGLCGLSILFTQTQGALVFSGIGAYLMIEARRDIEPPWEKLMLFALPCLSLCAAVLGYYCYVAGARRLFFDILVFPVTGLSGPVNSPGTYLHQFPAFHRAVDLFRFVPYVVILCLVPYCYLLSIYWLWKRRLFLDAGKTKPILLLNLVGLALFAAISSGPRFFRICTVASPALLVFAWHLQRAGDALKRARSALWILVGIFIVSLPINRQHNGIARSGSQQGTPLIPTPDNGRRCNGFSKKPYPGTSCSMTPERFFISICKTQCK